MPAYMLGHPVHISLYCTPDSIVHTILVKTFTTVCHQDTHDIIHFYTILQLYIQRHFSSQSVTRARTYLPRQKCHVIHCYTHARCTHHCPLLNMIQKYIPSSRIIFLLVEILKSRFKHKFRSTFFLFSFSSVRVRVRAGVQSATHL